MYIRRVAYTSSARTERKRGKGRDARRQAGSRRYGTPDSRAVGQMRLDNRDERGPRGLSDFEADPAVELRGAQRDIVDVGDSDGA